MDPLNIDNRSKTSKTLVFKNLSGFSINITLNLLKRLKTSQKIQYSLFFYMTVFQTFKKCYYLTSRKS